MLGFYERMNICSGTRKIQVQICVSNLTSNVIFKVNYVISLGITFISKCIGNNIYPEKAFQAINEITNTALNRYLKGKLVGFFLIPFASPNATSTLNPLQILQLKTETKEHFLFLNQFTSPGSYKYSNISKIILDLHVLFIDKMSGNLQTNNQQSDDKWR